MIVELLQKGEEPAYDVFIKRVAGSKIYHTLEWKRVIELTYGYRSYYIVAKEDEAIMGALPLFEVRSLIIGNRLVSIPFSHWVNILYENTPTVLEKLLGFARDLVSQRRCQYLESKHGLPLPGTCQLERSEQFFNSVLDLSRSIEEIWSGFESGSVRWGVNRAKRSGLVVKKGSTLEDYRRFYRLELETRRSQGVPPYPFRFFKHLWQYLGDDWKARLYLAYLDGTCIAGIIVLCHNKEAVYGYSASLKKPEYLRAQPNNLLLWTAIQELHDEGYRELDFGTTHPGNEGLLKFKSRWGTRDYKIPYYYFLNRVNHVPVIDRTSRKMLVVNSILRRMPIAVLERIGPFLLKQVG